MTISDTIALEFGGTLNSYDYSVPLQTVTDCINKNAAQSYFKRPPVTTCIHSQSSTLAFCTVHTVYTVTRNFKDCSRSNIQTHFCFIFTSKWWLYNYAAEWKLLTWKFALFGGSFVLHLQRHLLQVNFLESWPIPLSKVSQTEAVVVFQIIVIIGKNYHLDSVQSPLFPTNIAGLWPG